METILERVKRVIAGVIAVNEKSIVPQASLVEDLGADSLDLVNLTEAIEEEFSKEGKVLRFPEEVAEEIQSVQQILDFLAKKGFVDAPPLR
ncbi:MAG: acyl carrier protein [Pseudomonadota bacterium]